MKAKLLSIAIFFFLFSFTRALADNDPGNDGPSGAETFPLNGSVSGAIGSPYDVYDWYTVTIPSDGVINFTFTGDGSTNIINGYQLIDFSSLNPIYGVAYCQNYGSFLAFGLAAGSYYVLISKWNAYKGYTLTNTFTAALYNNDIEINDFYWEAESLPLNSSTTGHLHYRFGDNEANHPSDGIDWYAFTIPTTDSFSLQYVATTRDDGSGYPSLTMTIYNTNNLNYYYGLSTGTGSALYTNHAMPAGNYVVGLESASPANAGHSYQLVNYYHCVTTPITIQADGATTFCGDGESVNLSAIGSFNSYLWSDGETTATINVTASGNYSLTATNIYGCVNSSNTISVTVTTAATYFIDADGDGYGNPAVHVLACSQPSGYVSNNGDCNDANANIHPGAADVCNGIDDNCNGHIDEHAISATVSPTGTVSVCNGISVTLTANSSSGISYQWRKNSSSISGATNQTYSTKKAAGYSVKETNNFGCSSTSATTTISVLPVPAATITALGNLDICSTGSVMLQADSSAGYTFQWQKGMNILAGKTNSTYTATSKGTYKVVVTGSNGCSKTSMGTVVTKSCKESFDENVSETFTLYPNPASDFIMITFNSTNENSSQIKIINAIGEMMLEKIISLNEGSNQFSLDISSLPVGIYFVEMMNGEEKVMKKLVKE